jgi:hypothetical protein
MRKRLYVSLIFILILATSLKAQSGEWVKLSPPGGGFTIMLPGRTEEEVQPGDDFTFHSFGVRTDKGVYIIGYGDYAARIKLDPPRELDANRESFLKGLNARLIASKKVTLDGHDGLEFTGESSQFFLKSRVYLIGNRVYQLSVAIETGKDDTDNVNRFFASFAFTDAEPVQKP